MSSECLVQDDKSRSLSVEIPAEPSSSSNASPTQSPSTSTSTSSLPTQTQLLNVTFAPLPKLAPRKRRSTAPLGMAARAQLMRRRREYGYGDGQYQANPNPMWTDQELSEQQESVPEKIPKKKRAEGEEGEGEGEDPFLVLGRMVKVASKNIWRKVSHKDLSKKRKKDEEAGRAASVDGEAPEANRSMDIPPTPVAEPPRSILAPISQNGGEAGRGDEERFSSVGQTETIVEGHTKYSWINGSTGQTPIIEGSVDSPIHQPVPMAV